MRTLKMSSAAKSQKSLFLGIFVLLAFGVAPIAANDVVFLHGQVQMPDGSAPGHAVTIQLSCRGAQPVRQTEANKKGSYFLKVERDEFNHIARTLPASATVFNEGGATAGPCSLVASMPGFESSSIELSGFTINKDLTLPKIVLKPRADAGKK
jgi:hypothetical protein